jgi:benzodiazapine receptor
METTADQLKVNKRNRLFLALFITLCLLTGVIASIFNVSAIPTWYAGIRKPSWTPPNQVFAPVWTFLYVCIGVAGWLVWIRPAGSERKAALQLWGLQLLLNFVWTPLFFGLKLTGWAAIDIVALWIAIVAFILVARRVSVWASFLFVPYWAWVSYASSLNIAIWALN